MISIRSKQFRLSFEGMPLDSPLFNLALAAAPLEEPWFYLYDLQSDPNATTNKIGSFQEEAALLRRELIAWRKKIQKSAYRGSQPKDPQLLEVLRSRGYW